MVNKRSDATSLRRLLGTVFAAAVVFRVALYFSGLVDIVYDTYDSWEYRDLAMSMLRHGVFGLEGAPKMNRTPGYPGFLALVFGTLGTSQLAVTAAQITLDALTCVMIVHVAVALTLSRRAVMAIAALTVTCLFTSAYSMMMMTEVLYAFAMVAGLWAIATSPRPTSPSLFDATTRRVVLCAGALGCGILIRPALAPATALFGILVVAAAAARYQSASLSFSAGRQLLAFGATLVVIIAPWMARNYLVFHGEFTKPNHENVTLLGYKTEVPTYRHWYTREMLGYLYSNEEPFVMTKAYRAPEAVRYVYPEEKEDLQRAFTRLEAEILAGSQPIEHATLQPFERITERRYQAAPRLHVTAPVSRALRFWVTPRISSFWKDTSGHNSSATLIAGFTAYDVLYVFPGMLGMICGFARRARVAHLFVLAIFVGHTWMYTIWTPNPQSRYAIPLFPFMALSAGILLDQLVIWWRAKPAATTRDASETSATTIS